MGKQCVFMALTHICGYLDLEKNSVVLGHVLGLFKNNARGKKRSMFWYQTGSEKSGICYVALGKNGAFHIWNNKRFFYAEYIGKTKRFRFPRKKTLEEIKNLCEMNDYWED